MLYIIFWGTFMAIILSLATRYTKKWTLPFFRSGRPANCITVTCRTKTPMDTEPSHRRGLAESPLWTGTLIRPFWYKMVYFRAY